MQPQSLREGSLLQGEKYKINSTLGQGGFGITYLATQDILDRQVAVKEFFFPTTASAMVTRHTSRWAHSPTRTPWSVSSRSLSRRLVLSLSKAKKE